MQLTNSCVSGVRDPKDFPQTPGVEGIKALSQGLGDVACLAPVELFLQARCMQVIFEIWTRRNIYTNLSTYWANVSSIWLSWSLLLANCPSILGIIQHILIQNQMWHFYRSCEECQSWLLVSNTDTCYLAVSSFKWDVCCVCLFCSWKTHSCPHSLLASNLSIIRCIPQC